MRQTQIENMLKDHEDRILALEDLNKPKPVIVEVGSDNKVLSIKELEQEEKLIELGVRPAVGVVEKVIPSLLKDIDNIQEKQKKGIRSKESGVTVARPIPDTPQEKYDSSVEPKGLPNTTEGASTAKSLDGKSPVESKVKTKK